jgi:intracellular septation protein A
MTASPAGFVLWTYRRPFRIGSVEGCVLLRSGLKGLASTLLIDGQMVAHDFTPAAGSDAVRTHRLRAALFDDRVLDVEAGYNSWMNTGIAVRIDGALAHESHPGKPIAPPASAQKMMTQTTADGKPALDYGKLRDKRYAIGVDIALGILFFAVAKLSGLPTAALVGAGAGITLVIAQRFIKVDILGGLALFGIVMLLISAGFAIAFQDDDIIKMRSTIVGAIGAVAFLGDGLILGGRRLGKALSGYMAYADVDPKRLSIAMGSVGLVMALLNLIVARLTSTDIWLFYTSFVDIFFSMALLLYGINWSRRAPART